MEKEKKKTKNGDVFEGEYVKGNVKDMEFICSRRRKIRRTVVPGQQHGKGIYYFMNNNRYDGMWYQDYQHGEGTMYYHNGDLYVGKWVNDKREGEGTYTWANGAKYTGHWKNDKKNGKGIMNWDDGCKYEGDWKDDVLHGKGYLNIPMEINTMVTGRMIFNTEEVLILSHGRSL